MDGDCCRLRDQRHFLDGDGTKLAVNWTDGAGIIYPIIRNLPPLYQSQPNDSSSRSIGSYIMWMGIVADCVTSAIFLTAMAPNLLLIGLMKSASHATLSWGDWFLGMLPLSILLVLLVPWLAYVLYPPVLKSGDQVPRWAETELQAMGPLCSREKRMLGLMVGALGSSGCSRSVICWCCWFPGWLMCCTRRY